MHGAAPLAGLALVELAPRGVGVAVVRVVEDEPAARPRKLEPLREVWPEAVRQL